MFGKDRRATSTKTRIETERDSKHKCDSTAMTEATDWFKVRMRELKKLLRGSDYNTINDEFGNEVIADLTEWLKMKGAAKFQNNLNPVVAITENDDVVFLQDFEETPTDRSKAIIHLDGLYAFIKEKVNQDG